ncbi:hypothetical protein [Serratia sp. Tan611]|uniref:hypothetical protein n=1 Tax=Serratia sp. Tan611 TaxID=2773264 RepID=UPI001932D322|nr:hypothetical protein [Serratia sp. Tan611]
MSQQVQDDCFIRYQTMPSQDSINCFMATLECFAQRNQLTDDLSLAHFEHEFYLKNSESNDFISVHSKFGIDTAWACVDSLEMMNDRVVERIRARCGVAISLEMVFDCEGLIQRLHAMNDHAVCIFDPFYLPRSINFGVKHSLSVCIVNGYDPEQGVFGLIERKNGQSFVSLDAMRESTKHFIRSRGSCHIFHLAKVKRVVSPDNIDIRSDLERIIKHFYSKDNDTGLQALKRFPKRYAELLAFEKPFIIPWAERCFGERYGNARFLQKLLNEKHPMVSEEHHRCCELIELYQELGGLWRSFEVFHIYSVTHNNPTILQRNLPLLENIINNENRCLQVLEKLLTSLR